MEYMEYTPEQLKLANKATQFLFGQSLDVTMNGLREAARITGKLFDEDRSMAMFIEVGQKHDQITE